MVPRRDPRVVMVRGCAVHRQGAATRHGTNLSLATAPARWFHWGSHSGAMANAANHATRTTVPTLRVAVDCKLEGAAAVQALWSAIVRSMPRVAQLHRGRSGARHLWMRLELSRPALVRRRAGPCKSAYAPPEAPSPRFAKSSATRFSKPKVFGEAASIRAAVLSGLPFRAGGRPKTCNSEREQGWLPVREAAARHKQVPKAGRGLGAKSEQPDGSRTQLPLPKRLRATPKMDATCLKWSGRGTTRHLGCGSLIFRVVFSEPTRAAGSKRGSSAGRSVLPRQAESERDGGLTGAECGAPTVRRDVLVYDPTPILFPTKICSQTTVTTTTRGRAEIGELPWGKQPSLLRCGHGSVPERAS